MHNQWVYKAIHAQIFLFFVHEADDEHNGWACFRVKNRKDWENSMYESDIEELTLEKLQAQEYE